MFARKNQHTHKIMDKNNQKHEKNDNNGGNYHTHRTPKYFRVDLVCDGYEKQYYW